MKKLFSVIILIFVEVIFRLFIGMYTNPEFLGNHLFIKHSPTWHWHFYSPIGLSDLKMEDLTYEKKIEQKYWDEFVVAQLNIE